jgi:hypothetical protein
MKNYRQRLALAYHLLLVCFLTFSTVWPLA